MVKKPPYAGTVTRTDGIYVATSPYWTWSAYSSATTRTENGTWTSTKTANFKKLKPRNRPLNPFQATYDYVDYKEGYQTNGVASWKGYLDDFKSGTRLPLPAWPNLDTDTRARSKLLGDLKSSSVNLAQAFGERKQTADMLAKTVNRLASAAIAIRRGNFNHAIDLFGGEHLYNGRLLKRDVFGIYRSKKYPNGAFDAPKLLANHWLEFKYGWQPLLQDIYGSCELIAKTYYERRPTIVRATSLQQQFWKDYTLFYDSNYGTREKLIAQYKERTTYVCAFAEDQSFSQRMAQTGITNPLLLAWELLPYSFVVDWFVPVGDYLGNLDATVGLTFVSGTKTVRQDFVGTSSWVRYQTPITGYSQSGMGRSFLSGAKVRSVLTDFPSPTLEINPHIGVSRAISGIALLIQAFKR